METREGDEERDGDRDDPLVVEQGADHPGREREQDVG